MKRRRRTRKLPRVDRSSWQTTIGYHETVLGKHEDGNPIVLQHPLWKVQKRKP